MNQMFGSHLSVEYSNDDITLFQQYRENNEQSFGKAKGEWLEVIQNILP